jgi:outer membrane immunogenic protein
MRLIKLALLAATASVALATGGARAADLPRYKAPPPPLYTWSGLYLGVNIGYSWGEAKYDAVLTGVGAATRAEKMNGVIGGLQSGYNYQVGAWVSASRPTSSSPVRRVARPSRA